jgi:TM2 domain-containing membrane protein YozV
MNTTNLNPPTQKNRLITMILAMFLGIFGIDRFYLGKWKSGIAKGLTLGGLPAFIGERLWFCERRSRAGSSVGAFDVPIEGWSFAA